MYIKKDGKVYSQIETREYFLILDVEYLDIYSGKNYQKLRNIVMVRKTNCNLKTGEVTTEIRYYIDSICDIDLFVKSVRKE